jgi:acyl dehydratase
VAGVPAAAASAREVVARNLSRHSENRIHDDATARRLGFTGGGLVPGVEVYAYACHPAVRRWGRAWLERGWAEMRFLQPVYDGRMARAEAVEAGEELSLAVASEGVVCATGAAGLAVLAVPPALDDWAEAPAPPAIRPPASETSLAPGVLLGIAPWRPTADELAEYLRGVGETDPLYAREGLAHPGQILRLCNRALVENVVLGPWIHVGSRVENLAPAPIGQELTLRGRVRSKTERKGHRLVELDALVLAGGSVPVARIRHTAIWRLRGAAAAA